MARIYSTNFCDQGPTPDLGPTIVSFACPPDQTVILRDMTFSTPGFAHVIGPVLSLVVTCGIADAVVWELWDTNLDIGRTYMWEGREVMNGAGDIIATLIGQGLTFRANGYVLV
jgi:hypothetical protein